MERERGRSVRRLISILLLILFLSVSCFPPWSDETRHISVVGFVTEKETGEPVAGAFVVVSGWSSGAMTDSSGYYALLNIPSGRYVLSCGAYQFHPIVTDTVTISDTVWVVQNFRLLVDPYADYRLRGVEGADL